MASVKELKESIQTFLGEGKVVEDYKIEALTKPGENLGSQVLKVTLKVKNGKEEETLHGAMKTVPVTETLRQMFNSPVTFRKELGWYQNAVPTLQEFCKKSNKYKYDFFPKLIAGRLSLTPSEPFDNDAFILLENLKASGFDIKDSRIGFDLTEAKTIVTKMAELHAVPLALKLSDPGLFERKIKPVLEKAAVFETDDPNPGINMITGFQDMVQQATGTTEYDEKIKKIYENLFELNKVSKEPTPLFATFCHCDFWVNNIIIKHKPELEVKLIDFQLTELASPLRDLIFFVFLSCENQIGYNHFEELLDLYREEFVKVLKDFEVDTRDFTKTAFEQEVEVVVKDTVVLAQVCLMISFLFADKKDRKGVEEYKEGEIKSEYSVNDGMKAKAKMVVEEFVRRNWM